MLAFIGLLITHGIMFWVGYVNGTADKKDDTLDYQHGYNDAVKDIREFGMYVDFKKGTWRKLN